MLTSSNKDLQYADSAPFCQNPKSAGKARGQCIQCAHKMKGLICWTLLFNLCSSFMISFSCASCRIIIGATETDNMIYGWWVVTKSCMCKQILVMLPSKKDCWCVTLWYRSLGIIIRVCLSDACKKKELNRATHMTQKYSLALPGSVCFPSSLPPCLSPSQMGTLHVAYLPPDNCLWAL